MARDIIHQLILEVLLRDKWTITHDPFVMENYDPDWEIDFGAEKTIGAERMNQKIAVEAKSFLGFSFAYEFHSILGQHMNYKSGLRRIEPERELFLAVPKSIYDVEFQRQGIINSIEDNKLKYFVFNEKNKKIIKWNH